jgi:hypothetical protein
MSKQTNKKQLKRGKDVKKILKLARNVLCTDGWCQAAYALDKYGNTVKTNSKNADKFCVLGAVSAASRYLGAGESGYKAAKRQLDSTARTIQDGFYTFSDAIDFNDASGRTKKEVLGLIDRTIGRIA